MLEKKFIEAMYYYEHILIPELFFNDEISFTDALFRKDNEIWKLYRDFMARSHIKNPYSEDDFFSKVYAMTQDKKWLGCRIVFPRPETVPLCYEMYLFFDNDDCGKGCFTSEYGTAVRKDTGNRENCAFLCEWTDEQEHLNHGSFPLDDDIDLFAQAFEIHRDRF